MANSVDQDQTASKGAVCSGSKLFASILNLSVMLGNYLQQTTFADAFFFSVLQGLKYASQHMRFLVLTCHCQATVQPSTP